jgi:hypothetical protein
MKKIHIQIGIIGRNEENESIFAIASTSRWIL